MNETIGSAKPRKERNTVARILINAGIFITLLMVVSTVTTQYLASAFDYHPSLSGHVAGRFYWPWGWAVWALSWWSIYPELMQRALTIFTAGSTLALVIYALGLVFMSRRTQAIEGLHGTAHWANKKEIQGSGLMPKDKNKPAEGFCCKKILWP